MTDAEQAPKRNEVFSQQQEAKPVAPPPQPTKAADDIVFEAPVDSVPLLSAGKVYPEGNALHGLEYVDIRAMTARDEDILTSRALAKNGTMITQLLRSCIVDKRVDPAQMLSGDRNAIMTAIRITGYGRNYDVEVACPDCEEKSEFTFDLAALPVKRLNVEPVRMGENLFELVLPRSGARVQWRFLTGRDEEELAQIQNRKKKVNVATDDLITSRLIKMVVSINGVTDRSKIARALPMLPAQDSKALRDYVQKHEPGIDMVGEFVCKHCGESSEVEVPFGANFFWPNPS